MFVQHVVAARLRDPDLARALTGADGRVDQRGLEQRWAAQMENNVFETSDTRQDMGADDDHVVHLAVHTDYAEEVLKRQLSEEDQFGRISRAQAHVAMHLEWLAQDQNSVAEFKEFNQRWARLVNWLRQMGQHLEAKQAQAQEQELQNLRQPEPSVKEKEVMLTENLRRQLALSEAEAEERRKEEKHRAELRRAAEKTVAGKPTPKPMAAFDELGRLIQ
jgi:ribosomal protein S15P/S13E